MGVKIIFMMETLEEHKDHFNLNPGDQTSIKTARTR
jgi:hypothetical protein